MVKTKKPSMEKNIGWLLRIIWEKDWLLLALMIIDALCAVAIPFFGIYLPKLAIGLITDGADAGTIMLQIGGYVAAMAAVYFVGRFASNGKYWRVNAFRPLLMLRIFYKSLDIDYGEHESPNGQKRYQKAIQGLASGDNCATSRMIPAMCSLLCSVLGFGLYSGVLATLHPLVVALLVTTSLINYFAMQHAVKYQRSRKDDAAALHRRITYISSKTADFQYGKDIRLYGMKRLLYPLRDQLIIALVKLNNQIQSRWYFTRAVGSVITLLRDGGAYAYLIWLVIQDQMTVADFVFYFGAIAGFSNWISSILSHFSTINGAQLELFDIKEYLEQEEQTDPEGVVSAPDLSAAPSIVFENVRFSYEGSEEAVLQHFSIDIKPGEKIAVVGVNGAGKTTMVKLLCGFYKPNEGRILINGIDIKKYRREDLHTLFSAVFQDIMILPFTLAENIALRPAAEIDKARVTNSLQQAGLWEYIASLPKGIDSMMLRVTDKEGLLLSGGQQQKLLLARALYKNAPMLVLDEPTAALDPIAESDLYEQYHELARGKTALYISHRLASTRFCDRIIYLNNGCAEEVGTHDELMALQGGYAHMFDVQSHYYKENAEEGALV